MEKGYLSQYFDGIAAKKLSAVEVNPGVSNQHEFNGVRTLRDIYGAPDGKMRIVTRFLYLNDNDDPVIDDGFLTWYDARENHPSRTEWRLYYPSNNVSRCMSVDDTLFICKRKDTTALVIVTQAGSTVENQLIWLFDFPNTDSLVFTIKQETELKQKQMFFASRQILDVIGVEVQDYAHDYLEEMINRFNCAFPKTRDFSEYARMTVNTVSAVESPDEALLEWIDREELLFRTMEKHLIARRLELGFITDGGVDVGAFIAFSLSVQNRRKSRVGQALENHIEAIFVANNIKYTRTPITENNSKPDFIFPDIEFYMDRSFPVARLSMLGVKSTCKDRWRQVLDEADRIENKHLLTLEAAISKNQMDAMKDRKLQLVVTARIHGSYSLEQQAWLYKLADFIRFIKNRQY